MTRAGVLLLATLVAGACTMSSSSRRATMVGGAVLGLGGIAVIRSGSVDADNDGRNEIWLDDDLGAYAAGSLMLVAGTLLLLGGLASSAPDESSAAAPPAPPAPARTPAAELEPAASETRGVIVERVPAVPLPDLPTSTAAERLARQVRSASTHGHCEVAWIMWADLEKLDPIYARAVRDGPVMARCVE